MATKGKLRVTTDGYLAYCPGCSCYHFFDRRWKFDGNFDKPTFTPSLVVVGDGVETPLKCHSFLTAGHWYYLLDSTHELAGAIAELRDEA